MSSSTGFLCICTAKVELVVQCVGMPFMECCHGACKGLDCTTTAAGFACPRAQGCPSTDCSGRWEDWLTALNVYRCMHDAPSLVWRDVLYRSVMEAHRGDEQGAREDSLDVPGPAGPAVELMLVDEDAGPMDAARQWYSERRNCGTYPGCVGSTYFEVPDFVKNFSWMVWDGAREVGCRKNEYGVSVCRIKGLDYLSCRTPGVGGATAYRENVFQPTRTFAECAARLEDCGFTLPVTEKEGVEDIRLRSGFFQQQDLSSVLT